MDVDNTIDTLLKYAAVIGLPQVVKPKAVNGADSSAVQASSWPNGKGNDSFKGNGDGDSLDALTTIKRLSKCDFCDCYSCESRDRGGIEHCICRFDSLFDRLIAINGISVSDPAKAARLPGLRAQMSGWCCEREGALPPPGLNVASGHRGVSRGPSACCSIPRRAGLGVWAMVWASCLRWSAGLLSVRLARARAVWVWPRPGSWEPAVTLRTPANLVQREGGLGLAGMRWQAASSSKR